MGNLCLLLIIECWGGGISIGIEHLFSQGLEDYGRCGAELVWDRYLMSIIYIRKQKCFVHILWIIQMQRSHLFVYILVGFTELLLAFQQEDVHLSGPIVWCMECRIPLRGLFQMLPDCIYIKIQLLGNICGCNAWILHNQFDEQIPNHITFPFSEIILLSSIFFNMSFPSTKGLVFHIEPCSQHHQHPHDELCNLSFSNSRISVQHSPFRWG